MHVAEIMARKVVWEVYSTHDAINLQSTYEMATAWKKPHTTPVYNHSRFELINAYARMALLSNIRLLDERPCKNWSGENPSMRISI